MVDFINTTFNDEFQLISYKRLKALHMTIRFFFLFSALLNYKFWSLKAKNLKNKSWKMNILPPKQKFHDLMFLGYCGYRNSDTQTGTKNYS